MKKFFFFWRHRAEACQDFSRGPVGDARMGFAKIAFKKFFTCRGSFELFCCVVCVCVCVP